MTIEAGVVVGYEGQTIHWHLPEGRTGGSLPCSRELWDVLWAHRDVLRGFAHSHPGPGTPVPSETDVTTFSAIERALGRRLTWWITTDDCLVAFHWVASSEEYAGFAIQDTAEPPWVRGLRLLSKLPSETVAQTEQGLPPGRITELWGASGPILEVEP